MIRLLIDFPNTEAMADWFDSLRDPAINGFPTDAAIFEVDGLDQRSVTWGNSYIVKRVGDRPEETRLVIKKTTTEERIV